MHSSFTSGPRGQLAERRADGAVARREISAAVFVRRRIGMEANRRRRGGVERRETQIPIATGGFGKTSTNWIRRDEERRRPKRPARRSSTMRREVLEGRFSIRFEARPTVRGRRATDAAERADDVGATST